MGVSEGSSIEDSHISPLIQVLVIVVSGLGVRSSTSGSRLPAVPDSVNSI